MGDRPTRAVFLGFSEYWPRFHAEGIGRYAPERFSTSWLVQGKGPLSIPGFATRIARADLAIRVGVSLDQGSLLNRLFVNARGWTRTQPVLFWTGTDVLNHLDGMRDGTIDPRTLQVIRTLPSLAGAPRLTEELAELGVKATTVLHPVPERAIPRSVAPLPDRFSVLTYIPAPDRQRFEFYGGPALMEAARALPDVPFTVCGVSTLPVDVPPNVIVAGRVDDMDALYRQSVAVVRMVKHDAIGGMVTEALFHGRWVFYSYDQPNVTWIGFGDSDGLVAALSDLRTRYDRGTLGTNDEGRRWALDTYDPAARFGDYARELDRICRDRDR